MILAIDTTLAATSACLLAPGALKPVAAETLEMDAGHAEALVPLIERVVARVPTGFDALTRVAVTVGPGSFTGIRIGVAAARAIGLACGIPVVGVSTLAALAAPAIGARPPVVAAIDARHGNVYVQSFGARGETMLGPTLMPAAEAARSLGLGPLRLIGSGGAIVARAAFALGITAETEGFGAFPDIAFVARLGGLADPRQAAARPLYLKAPDARPPAASGLVSAGAG